jgi:hypothetical protein
MTTKYFVCKKQTHKQLGFFDLGIGLGFFLLFSGVAAVITTTNDNDSKETVAMQEQTAQSQYYVTIDPEC